MLVQRRLSFIIAACLFLSSLLYYVSLDRPTWLSRLVTDDNAEPERHIPQELEFQGPLEDNFPLGKNLKSLPAIPSWNRPPQTHVPEKTPLFIGFTRNWFYLQQTVLSYITAGWPPEDIYVVDNTGTMKANFPPNPRLSLENPFFLNVTRLTKVFGVNVIATPTVMTFAQLQNFYLYTAQEKGWEYFFWGHMDTIVNTDERYTEEPFKNFYSRVIDVLGEVSSPTSHRWGIKFFQYDWLALNNVAAFMELGGWDMAIPFYKTDCDMHERLRMAGYSLDHVFAGNVTDVGGTMDLNLLFRKQIDLEKPPTTQAEMDAVPELERGDESYDILVEHLGALNKGEWYGPDRLFWQKQQSGGQGEPFYRDADGFDEAIKIMTDGGFKAYEKKWRGYDRCDLIDHGFGIEDAWGAKHVDNEVDTSFPKTFLNRISFWGNS